MPFRICVQKKQIAAIGVNRKLVHGNIISPIFLVPGNFLYVVFTVASLSQAKR